MGVMRATAQVKKDLTPQFVNCDLADNKYSGIIREAQSAQSR